MLLYSSFCIALEAKPSVMYRRTVGTQKSGVWRKCTNRLKDGHGNARAVHRNVYINKLTLTYTLKSFTIEMHASSMTTVHVLPLMQSDVFQNSSSRWSSDPQKEFGFCVFCHAITSFLFSYAIIALWLC